MWMGSLHTPTWKRLSASSDIIQIYITKCFFEVLLALQKGLTYTARSSRLQDTSLLQGSLPASLHPNATVRRSQTLVSDFVLLHFLRNVQFSPDSVFASCQTYLSLPSFTSFSFPQKLSKVTSQAMREGKRRIVKNRRETNENKQILGKEVQTIQREYFFNQDIDSPVNVVQIFAI